MFTNVHLIFYFNLLCAVSLCLSCFSSGSFDSGKRPLTKKEEFVVEEVDRMLNQVLKDIKEYGDRKKSEKDFKISNNEEKDNVFDFPSKEEDNHPINFPTLTPRVTPTYFRNEYKPQEPSESSRISGSSGFPVSSGDDPNELKIDGMNLGNLEEK
ncbi:UNVERIFIED_CONTAM: hypothetical protein RMT77_010935 [Armadillidium vulgare]